MFIFNTTFVVDVTAISAWESWMKVNYFPVIRELVPGAVVKTFEVMLAKQDAEQNFSVQWTVATPDELSVINSHSNMLLKLLTQEQGTKCLSFSTILKEYHYQ